MAKKVFERIWRTFMIVVNSVFALAMTLLGFVTLFDGAASSAIENAGNAIAIMLFVNLFDWFARKHIRNY